MSKILVSTKTKKEPVTAQAAAVFAYPPCPPELAKPTLRPVTAR